MRRYAALRAAQRVLYPMRPLSVTLLADSELREIRERLRGLGPNSKGGGATEGTGRAVALREIDRKLDAVSTELRGRAAQTSFSELRATLPALCEKRPDEVAALLDVCLEDADSVPKLLNLIEYLVTLLATEWRGGERSARSDPSNVTLRLRAVCEEMAGSDPGVLRSHCEVFEQAILELAQAESVEPVIQRIRGSKERLGLLMFAPELLVKIVEYNIAVSNRLEDEIEAERTMHVLEAGITAALAEAEAEAQAEVRPESEEDSEPSAEEPEPVLLDDESWVDPDTFEIQAREEMALQEIAEALRSRLAGHASTGPTAELAAGLDVSGLSHWENQAFLAGPGEDEAGVLRSLVVVGLLVRHRAELESALAELDLDAERLRRVWAPQLDSMVQKAIASRLTSSDYRTAKQLAQSRARYLHPILEPRRRSPKEPTRRQSGLRASQERRRLRSASRARARRARAAKARTRSPRARLVRRLAWVAAATCIVAVGFGIRSVSIERRSSLRPMPVNQVRAISPYLGSASLSPGTHGTKFVATVGDEWEDKDDTFHREEAIRIGTVLKSRQIQEMALFDNRYRMVAYFERGWLIYPTPGPR